MRTSFLVLALAVIAGCQSSAPTDQVVAPDTLRVMAYNIHHGEGMDLVLDLERIAAMIREVEPDVVTLQEVDSVTTRTESVDQAAELGRLTGLTPVFGRFMAYREGAYGMAVLSRLPIVESANLRLPDGDEPRTAVSLTVETPSGRQARVVGIHFYRTEVERMAQAVTLDSLLAGAEVPTVLAGDFNSTPGSAVMEWLAGGWTVLDKGEDRLTFPSFGPEREIDFVAVRPEEQFEVLGHWLLDEPVVSDHRAMVVDLVVR